MTLEAFESKWMRIATTNKLENKKSGNYERDVTGQKGIGRFAVRFLGKRLIVETVALDKKTGKKTKLSIDFDWEKIDKAENLNEAKIKFYLMAADDLDESGTTLKIKEMKYKSDFLYTKKLSTDLLKMASPYPTLESGGFKRVSNVKD